MPSAKVSASIALVLFAMSAPTAAGEPGDNVFYCNPTAQVCVGYGEFDCVVAARVDPIDYEVGLACAPSWQEVCAAYDNSGHFGCVRSDDPDCVGGISHMILNWDDEYTCVLEEG